MERYGLHGKCLSWFKSYLLDQKLSVSCKTADTGEIKSSTLNNIEYGTPQGSCLGPLIFLIFCNDLQHHLIFLECIQFADDTTLHVTHHSIQYIRFSLEHDLNILQDWFIANKLTLNVGKSVCILFGKHRNQQLNLHLGPEKIPQATCTKFLGMWIDHDLSWREHVSNLLLKLKSKLNLLKAGKHFLSTHALRILYFAQIHSNLTYGIGIWGSLLTQDSVQKLQRIQDNCMQIIGHRGSPIDHIYHTQKILTIPKQIELELCKLWHKKLLGLLPPKLTSTMAIDCLNRSSQKTHRYTTHQKHLENQPKSSQEEYLVKGNRLYANLGTTMQSYEKMKPFVRALKSRLLTA